MCQGNCSFTFSSQYPSWKIIVACYGKLFFPMAIMLLQPYFWWAFWSVYLMEDSGRLKSIFTVSQPMGCNNKITRCRNRGCNIGPFTFKKAARRFKQVKFVLWVEHFITSILIKQNSFLFNQILLSTLIHNKNWEFEG